MLQERGFQPDTIEYLQQAPSPAELSHIIGLLGVKPRDLLRTSEPEHRELGLADASLTDQQLLEAMSHHPRLIQRPIVVHGSRARIGRPPEAVLEILDRHD